MYESAPTYIQKTNFEALPDFPCLGKYIKSKSSDEKAETCI